MDESICEFSPSLSNTARADPEKTMRDNKIKKAKKDKKNKSNKENIDPNKKNNNLPSLDEWKDSMGLAPISVIPLKDHVGFMTISSGV